MLLSSQKGELKDWSFQPPQSIRTSLGVVLGGVQVCPERRGGVMSVFLGERLLKRLCFRYSHLRKVL